MALLINGVRRMRFACSQQQPQLYNAGLLEMEGMASVEPDFAAMGAIPSDDDEEEGEKPNNFEEEEDETEEEEDDDDENQVEEDDEEDDEADEDDDENGDLSRSFPFCFLTIFLFAQPILTLSRSTSKRVRLPNLPDAKKSVLPNARPRLPAPLRPRRRMLSAVSGLTVRAHSESLSK